MIREFADRGQDALLGRQRANASPGGGFASNGATARWTLMTNWTAAPASITRITVDHAALANVVKGMPIRFQTVVGGTTLFYAIVTGVNSGSIDVAGPSLSGTLTDLWVGVPELVIQLDLIAPGFFAENTGFFILRDVAQTFLTWMFSDAVMVQFRAWIATPGAGTAAVNVSNAGAAVATADVVPGSGGVDSAFVDSAHYTIVRGNFLEISVSVADADAEDLTLNCTIILK